MARTTATLTLSGVGWSIVVFLGRANIFWQRLLLTGLAGALGLILVLAPLRAFFALQALPLMAWFLIAAVTAPTHLVLRRLSHRSP